MLNPERHAQLVVVTCFTMATLAWGIVFYGFSFFLESLLTVGRFTTAEISGAIAVSFWSGIPAGVLVGRWLRHHPPLMIVVYGVSATALGLYLLPGATTLVTLYIAFILFGTGYPCLSTSGISGTLNYYIKERYASRLSVALTGASIGGACVVPAMVWLRESVGLQSGSQIVAGIALAMLLPPALLLLRKPRTDSAAGAPPSASSSSIRGTVWSIKFCLITFAAACALTAQVGFLTHQIPLIGMYINTEQAAWGVSITATTAIAGRFLTGWLAERIDLAALAALAALIQASGMGILAGATQLWLLYLGCAVFGFVVGAIVMLPALLIRDRFGSALYSELYGYTNIGLYAGAGFGPIVVGALREADGNYVSGLAVLIAVHLIAVVTFWGLRQPRAA